MTIESILTQLESLHAASTGREWRIGKLAWNHLTGSFDALIRTMEPKGKFGSERPIGQICMFNSWSDPAFPDENGNNGWPLPMQENAEIMIVAHNHLPAVIAEVRRLQEQRRRLLISIDSVEAVSSQRFEENTALKAEVERMRDALTTIVDRADRTDIGWWAVSPYAYEVAKAALGESK